MENFIVSARKYRPATFEMVVGQTYITNTLKSAITGKHLAQSYLFCGPRGVGKTTCARIFAKTINCSNLSESGEACDKCESCISFSSLRSFNIHELDAASNNKVDDIRLLTDQVRIPPQVGKYSIYIIDEVHMLSSSAFNAFLKTLEEPPSHAIFILATTEKHKIIPTILSRCQIFDFHRIRVEDIVARLSYVASNESVKAEEEALHVIAQKADGALRDALSIFDQMVSFSGKTITYKDVIENLNVLDYEYYFRTVDAAVDGDISKVLLIFNEVLEKGFDGHNFIAGLNSHLRDLLVSKDEITLGLLEATPSVRQRYMQQARKSSAEFLVKALETGSSCDLSYKNSKNQRLHVELALIKLCSLSSQEEPSPEKKKPETAEGELNPEPEKASPQKEKYISSGSTRIRDIKAPETTTELKNQYQPKEAEVRSISIRDVISENDANYPGTKPADQQVPDGSSELTGVEDFNSEKFLMSWAQFIEEVKPDGIRVASMFSSIRPEVHPDMTISLHMTNAAQRDIFVKNYKPRLITFLERKFGNRGLNIEAVVDTTETEGIIYSDEQKYNHLVSKFPAMKEMRKAFNLDFE
jgi:DNA polymerase-3 subunit gamma/tau